MRILYVLSAVQEPRLGSLRHYHFLRVLSQRHSITLLMLAHPELSSDAKREFAARTERLLLFSAPPQRQEKRSSGYLGAIIRRTARWHERRRVLRDMRKRFLQLTSDESYDLVLFHGKGLYPVIRGFRELPVVADFSGAATMRLRLQLRHARGAKLLWQFFRYLSAKRTERKLLEQTDHLAFISSRDREAVIGKGGRAKVIPNGIDLTYWQRGTSGSNPCSVVFTGTMSYSPNEDAAIFLVESILPLLRKASPDAQVFIVGRNPTPALVEAGKRHPGVTVTGAVEDVRPYLEEATVFVAPIRYASGLQNKILEALAMEVPVVTTPLVAAGLQVGEANLPPIKVAETAADFASAVTALLRDESARTRMAADGRRFVEAHFDWDRGADQLHALCLEAAAGSRPL